MANVAAIQKLEEAAIVPDGEVFEPLEIEDLQETVDNSTNSFNH